MYFASCTLALFSLLNPRSNIDVLHLALFSFLITYLMYSGKRKIFNAFWMLWTTTLFIALFAYFIYYPDFLILGLISIGGGAISFFTLRKFFVNPNNIFIIFLIVFFLISAYFNSYNLRNTIAQEPAPKSYFNDYLGFLRNFYLVEIGNDYYDGLVKTHTEDGRSSTIPSKVWNWRLPTYAYLWDIFPGNGGLSVYVFFLILSSLSIFMLFKIGELFLPSSTANLVPFVLFPYFHFGARDLSFLEMEWWAMSFLIIAIFAIVKNRLNLLFVSSAMAMILRELYLIPILLWSALMVVGRNYRKAQALTFAVIIFLVVISFHYFKVTEYIPRSWNSLSLDSKSLSLSPFQQTLSYGSVDYLFFRFRPFLVSLVLTVLMLAISFYQRKINLSLLLIPLTALSMTIFSLQFVTLDADYWGITYVPFLLMSLVILAIITTISDDNK